MKFYNLKEVPIERDNVFFKVSPVGSFIAMLIFLGIASGFFFIGRNGNLSGFPINIPKGLAYVFSAISILIARILFGFFRARLKPSNWLLRCNATGVLIKYRSYQNWRMPADDLQVVGLDYSEIAWARKVNERRVSPGLSNNEQIEYLSFLDFCLVKPDITELQKHLDEERQRKWSFVAVTYPVEVLPEGIVRLKWRGSGGGSYANPDKALRWLGRFITIADAVSQKANLTHQTNLTPSVEDGKILQLVRSGDKMGAIKLTRQIYGCSLNEAVKFVDKL